MSLENKRQLYACGTKFTTLDQVSTWSQHVPVDKTELPSGVSFPLHVKIFLYCLLTRYETVACMTIISLTRDKQDS